MVRLSKKVPCKITLDNLAPPYLDYDYFTHADELPFRHTANEFELVNAWWLIEAATLVYADEDFVNEKVKQNAGLAEVRFFNGDSTQCFVASNANFAIVAFRGSETRMRSDDASPRHILADWLTNFDFLPVQWDLGGNVHTGFKNALQEVWQDLEDYLSELQENDCKIWMTGHSLGAALATLAAGLYGNIQGTYTFGSPRVGDREFGEKFIVNAYRFVNGKDIVTKVPPAGMYNHVGELKYIDNNGNIHDDANQSPKWTDEIEDKIKGLFNSPGQLGNLFDEVLIDPIVDHVPTLYAIHIWNNIPLVGE